MNSNNVTMIVYFLIILFLNIGHLTAQESSPVLIAHSLQFTSSNLPIIVIDTHGRKIYDQYRISADLGIIDNGEGRRNYVTDPFNNYHGKIAIELRGSSSMSYPKKQYRFETQDSLGNNLNVSLMGMPRENDWILYGPYDDQSLIRNVLAYKISNAIGRYASRTRFCEVILNNDYQGIYVLLEKIKRDKYRVNISPMDSSDVTGDALTGGYIIKLDKEEGENVGGWRSAKGIAYQYHFPKADEIIYEQKNYIKAYMNVFEDVMTRPDFADSAIGYPKYIDVASFVDHFILNEFCKNIDAYRISAFLYKDRDSEGGKLHAGPIWDFNLSFGKTWFKEDQYRIDEWEIDHNHYRSNDWPKVPYWWEKLGHEPTFATQAEDRWFELRRTILRKDSLFKRIDLLVDTLAEASVRNFTRWPQSGNVESYKTEILILKHWISDRIDWIENNFNRLTSIQEKSDREKIPARFSLEQNYPNPFNSTTIISFELPKASTAKVEIFDLNGRKVLKLFDAEMPAGHHSIEFDSTHLSSGIYLYKIQVDNFSAMRKMTLLR